MNAASLHNLVSVPVAASPIVSGGGGASGGITPAAGQGFVPASGGSGAAASGAASKGAAASGNAAPSDGTFTADQAMQLLTLLQDQFKDPFVAADGTIYVEQRKTSVSNGTFALAYVAVGKVDPTTKRVTLTPEILTALKAKAAEAQEEKSGATKKLVKVDDQYVWETFVKGEDGTTKVTDVKPATDEELAALQQKQAQEAAQTKLQDRGDWQQKIGVVAQHLGIFGSAGQLLMGLGGGPNPYTGKPGAGWISGYILATRLNGKAEGKLLPQFMQSGPFASALEWGIQAYGMLDLGNDIRIVKDFVTKAPPLPAVNPNAVADLVKRGYAQPVAEAMAGLGKELRDGTLQMVEGSANTAVLNTKLGAAQLVPKADLHAAFQATDPVQSAGLKLRGDIDSGVVKGLGVLKGLVQPAMIGATALGLVSSTISVKNAIDQKGAKYLVENQGGRGALLGALSSAAFLGMYVLPMVLPGLGVAGAAVAAASSAANIASNVLGGVQLLNSYGLFGSDGEKKGFLDNDAFRAGFLIPPLTPIGAFAFYMKKKKEKAAAEAAKLKAAESYAQQQVAKQRDMAKLQLQTTGQVSGATRGQDGTVIVSTGVPNDPAKIVAILSGAAAGAAPAQAAAPPAAAAAPPTAS